MRVRVLLLFALLPILGVVCGAAAAESNPSAAPLVKMVFIGDIMLADGPGKAIDRGVDPFAEFAPFLKAADLVVGNLECVVASSGEPIPEKPWTFEARPRCTELLKRYFHAVCTANNHSGDYGKGAFVEQCDLLEKAGMPYFGGGRNLADARKPLMVERKGLRIALLGANDFKPREFEAGEKTPGIAWLEEKTILEDIRAARETYKADLVIPFLHWGVEGEPKPEPEQEELARKMIDAGADMIIGGHPHRLQSVGEYRGKPIIYSLGNFVFDGFEEAYAKRGWLLRMTVSAKGVAQWDAILARMDEEGIPHLVHPQPQRCRLRRHR